VKPRKREWLTWPFAFSLFRGCSFLRQRHNPVMDLPIGWIALPSLVFNLLAFAAQGLDKRKAERGKFRTPETTLLLLGLPLSAAGMLLGMRVFRHKTRKRSFVAKATLVTIANLLMLAGLGYLAMQAHVRFRLALY